MDLRPRKPGRPKGRHTRQLNEEDRQRVCILYFNAHLNICDIIKKTGFSTTQIKLAIKEEKPRFSSRGAKPTLSADQANLLIDYVCSTKEHRRMSWASLSAVSFLIVGLYVSWIYIRETLYHAGFKRYHARVKPPISEKNRQLRLEWAQAHVNWTVNQWRKILWTNETWVTGGHHRRIWVTRRKGEELNPTYIVKKHQWKNGWMFWGCFSGVKINESLKGPSLFWEKDWGTITEESYCQHTVPLINGWIRRVC